MKDFDRDATSRAVSIPAQNYPPSDNDSEATGDTPAASAEDRSAKDRGRQDSVGSTTGSGDPSHALSTRVEGSGGGDAPRGIRTTLHLKRPIRTGVVLQVPPNGRPKALIVDRVTRQVPALSERPGLPARGGAPDGGGAKVQNLSELLAKSAPPGGTTAATPNAPASAYASSCVSDEREWRPPSPVASPGSTTVGDTHEPTKSSRKDSGDTGPARTRAGSQTVQPVNAIAFPGDARGLLREKEVAEILGLSSATLRNWRTRGDGPPFVRLSRRAIRYEPVALREWVAQRTRRSTSDGGNNNG
jgi:predicted DNA-binding transcriptional regulator AlpA